VEGGPPAAPVAVVEVGAVPQGVRWRLDLVLPWPPSVLHPNNAPRNLATAWGAKKRYRARCRADADYQRRRAAVGAVPPGLVRCVVEFQPPDRAHRDVLNLGMAIKHAVDGVADALGVNDRRFRPWVLDFGEVAPGGRVALRLEVLAPPPLAVLAGGALD
jgi:crossover junction endodeoxyribonuclease RusA